MPEGLQSPSPAGQLPGLAGGLGGTKLSLCAAGRTSRAAGRRRRSGTGGSPSPAPPPEGPAPAPAALTARPGLGVLRRFLWGRGCP